MKETMQLLKTAVGIGDHPPQVAIMKDCFLVDFSFSALAEKQCLDIVNLV